MGSLISEKDINKNNINDFLGGVVKYVIVHFLTKKKFVFMKFAVFC